jgi:hypothetical protein
LELDEEQFEAILEAVQGGMQEVGNDLEEIVREQLRKELAGFRDALDWEQHVRRARFRHVNCARVYFVYFGSCARNRPSPSLFPCPFLCTIPHRDFQ